MAVSDTMLMLAIGIMFTYLVVYRKNKFFGNLAFVGLSLSVWFFIDTTAGSAVGMIMFFGSLVNLIYDMVGKLSNNTISSN